MSTALEVRLFTAEALQSSSSDTDAAIAEGGSTSDDEILETDHQAAGTSNDNPKQPQSLLTLPGEIKNMIYRLCLVKDSPIEISRYNPPPQEPGLLRTCKEVRTDAIRIYYNENHFWFRMLCLNARPYIRFCRRSSYQKEARVGFLTHTSEFDWANLKVWLKAFYHGQCEGMRRELASASQKTNRDLAIDSFEAVDRARSEGLSWEGIEVKLEAGDFLEGV